jgi:nitrous oxidase accessory protein NosD
LAAGVVSSLFTTDLQILGNLIEATALGIGFSSASTHFGDTRVSGNTIIGPARGPTLAGISFTGFVGPGGDRVEIDSNALFVAGDGIITGIYNAHIVHNDISGEPPPAEGHGIHLTGTQANMDGIEIAGNRIFRMAGAGVFIDGTVIAAMIKQNSCENVGYGIGMGPNASAVHLTVENNQILNASPTRLLVLPGGAFGIFLVEVQHAQVAGNTIHNLATIQGSTVTVIGIEAFSCSSIRIRGNELIEIGPPGQIGPSAGIEVTPPFEQLEVDHNIVRRSQTPPSTPETSVWRALHVGSSGTSTPGSAVPLVLPLASGRLAIFAGAFAAPVGAGAQITNVTGNVLEAFGGASTVDVEISGPCTFADNQCLYDAVETGPAGPPPIVFISATSIIAGNNYLQGLAILGTGLPVAMLLNAGQFNAGPFTVLGNLCSGTINIGPTVSGSTKLGLPWAPLNIPF